MLKRPLCCNKASSCLLGSFAVFVRFILYWIPALTEILLVTVSRRGSVIAQWTIIVCAVIQTLLAFPAGARLVYQTRTLKLKCCCCRCNDDDSDNSDDNGAGHCCTKRNFCCPSPFAVSSIWSGSQLSFILPGWVFINFVCSWFDAEFLLWPIHLICYFPIPVYLLGLGIGYIWTGTCKGESKEVPIDA